MPASVDAAFPPSLADAVASASLVMTPTDHEPVGEFVVWVAGAPVQIPYRIYNPEPRRSEVEALDGAAAHVLACLYTRHHDGRVRQRSLQRIVHRTEPWVAPFVVQLIGEYIVEILIDIREGLELDTEGSPHRVEYGRFVAHNPAFLQLTAKRVVSYWGAYYKHAYPDRSAYPGFQLLEALRQAAAEQPV